MKYSMILILLLQGCSNLRKTIIYSSLSGAMIGATTGAALSPNKQSRGPNAIIWGLVGVGIAGLSGYYLYQDDPRNFKLKQMIKESPKKHGELELDLGPLKIDANLSKTERYKVPLKELPSELKGKVNQQYLIKYQSKEKYLRQGQKTYYIPKFQIFEHAYDEKVSGQENEEEKL